MDGDLATLSGSKPMLPTAAALMKKPRPEKSDSAIIDDAQRDDDDAVDACGASECESMLRWVDAARFSATTEGGREAERASDTGSECCSTARYPDMHLEIARFREKKMLIYNNI